MHTGDRCFAVHCITALSNGHDSYSLAIFWEATICSAMVTQNKSDKLRGDMAMKTFSLFIGINDGI